MSAASDLRKRIVFERRLAKQLRSLDQDIVQSFTKALARGDRGIDVDRVAEEQLTEILKSSYRDSGNSFSKQLSKKLPKNVATTAAEREAITSNLSRFYADRAPQQARHILTTTKKNMLQAIQLAEEEAVLLNITSQRDKARLAGNILDRKLLGREGGIATLETLAPTEAAKLTEFQVLSGASDFDLSINGGAPDLETTKTWETMGDERVRPAGDPNVQFDHITADEQTVSGGKPFLVSGQNLNYPGDTSLGASMGNVANCRCTVRFDVAELIAVRERRMAA